LQLLIVLGLGALFLGLMGTAYLGEQNGEIDLLVQALGWGEKNIEVPITDAEVEIRLNTIPGDSPEAPSQTIVEACVFHSDERIDEVEKSLSDGRLICKILNEDGNAILEGSMTFTSYTPSSTVVIDMNQPVFEDAILFENGFDLRLIVQGPIGESQ